MMMRNKTRKQKFKDLMRYRTTLEQGLTLKQIFCEVYDDVFERIFGQGPRYVMCPKFNSWSEFRRRSGIYRDSTKYLKRIMKEVRKTDDDFRWLSASMPIRTNKIDKTTGKKTPPYIEYRYVNIKASETPELLSEINAYRAKHLKACA